MSKRPADGPASTETITVPFERVANLVRQLSHDFRNGLNTLDLQAAFLQELVTDPEALPEVKRIRTMVSGTAKTIQALSAPFSLGQAHCVTYSAKILVEDFRSRLLAVLPEEAPQIAWKETLGEEAITVDLEMIFRAFSEVFKNAVHFHESGRKISARAFTQEGRFVLELQEGKSALPSPPETWGCEPLVSTRRGGFGMGLFSARRILALHQGTLDFAYEPAVGRLTTRLALPLALV